MKEIILVKYGEIILKGGNRPKFEKKLMENIRNSIRNVAEIKMYMAQATVYIEPLEEDKIDIICERLCKIFGIVTVAKAAVCEKNIESIKETAVNYCKDELLPGRKFKVEAKRSDKSFPLNSVHQPLLLAEQN